MPKLRITGKHHRNPKPYKYLRRERPTLTLKTGSTRTPSGKKTWGWLKRPGSSLISGSRNLRRCLRVWTTNNSCTIWRTTWEGSHRSKKQLKIGFLKRISKRNYLSRRTGSSIELGTLFFMTLIHSKTLSPTWSTSNNPSMILRQINLFLVKIWGKE